MKRMAARRIVEPNQTTCARNKTLFLKGNKRRSGKCLPWYGQINENFATGSQPSVRSSALCAVCTLERGTSLSRSAPTSITAQVARGWRPFIFFKLWGELPWLRASAWLVLALPGPLLRRLLSSSFLSFPCICRIGVAIMSSSRLELAGHQTELEVCVRPFLTGRVSSPERTVENYCAVRQRRFCRYMTLLD
ncbi:uncharacterized protein B0I36DRAFT_129725 [Microdochium trichocladiopsis]|uniref:Uncharacterized protein n=1 Tax=Microdochium trichocladiopsis TaxID=1682393 RepID=A0A9P9BSW2_9PEZI|nr:uncharacterized protein B0I36DRAFT_129725 [Microdochium trichocladiopsis]KAH7029231.1 hypothetical protein B0I36DRAFT_129725 [Microdochium trichocladiopsis]